MSDSKSTSLAAEGEDNSCSQVAADRTKAGLAEMLKGGVIMDVTTPEQARLAEKTGACAVMALEQIPAEIRRSNGVARMADPRLIKDIMKVVSIPVMAKCRIGHRAEAEALQALGVDFIDESEVLTPADDYHIRKESFSVPFVCGCRDLGEALRRISEGASMIRTKGEAGTGNIVHAIRQIRAVREGVRRLLALEEEDLDSFAKELQAPVEVLRQVRQADRLPVVNFAAGGIATPADAAFCMQLGVDGIFVGSGIFQSSNPERRANAIVDAATFFIDGRRIAEVSEGLGPAMLGTGTLSARASSPVKRWEDIE